MKNKSYQIRFLPRTTLPKVDFRWYIVIVSCLFPFFLIGQINSPIFLETEIDSFKNIDYQTSIYVDLTSTAKWKEVLNHVDTEKFVVLDALEDFGKFDQSRNAYWLHFEIHTSFDFNKQLVYFRTLERDSITFFQLENKRIVAKQENGLMIEKDNDEPNVSISNRFAIPIILEPSKQYQFLVRLKSSPGFSRKMNCIIHRKDYDFSSQNEVLSILFIMQGGFFFILVFVAFFSLMQFFQNKDKAFLFYAIYLTSLILFYMRSFLMHNPKWEICPVFVYDYWYYIPFLFPVYISYFFFVGHFLDVKNQLPQLYVFIKWYLKGLALIFIVDRILHMIDVNWAYEFMYWTRLFLHLSMVYFLFSLLKTKNRLAIYTLIGSGLLLLSALGTQVLALDPASDTYLIDTSDFSVMIGVLLEIFFFSIGLGYKSQMAEKNKFKIENELALKDKEANYLKDLNDLKTNFYTNITHEFRTPLTVIQGMADELENHPKKEPQEKLGLIKKNSHHLLSLVNQMLELAKLQEGKGKLDLQQDDVILFVKYVVEAHESFAKIKNVGLQFYSEEKELQMDFDAKKIEQVLTNLISNAIKFTPEYGKILVIAKKKLIDSKPMLEIQVKDSGIGISSQQLPYIFDRFHQANLIHENQGSGIGLALVKELMSIMNGKIKVESEPNIGTTFFLNFPIQNNAPVVFPTKQLHFDKKIIPTIQKEIEDDVVENGLPILLIIEDNADVIFYLKKCLEDEYQILIGRNGKLGVEKAIEVLPDIIISDVMMPEMDGFEVCATLKQDERTNHIPIILLTAKATSEDKLAGLTHGADAYLIKPFEKEELLVRLNNLMQIRKTLQKKYSSTLISEQIQEEEIIETKESLFIKKLEQIVIQHMEEDDFSVNELAQELLLSRSQTHRKIKALTGMSTAIYIRHIRLQKAKILLTSPQLSISEIAYQVGFKSPVYFSQIFKETFAESPSRFRK